MGENTFSGGADHWLDRLGNLRNVVRQEMVSRQLDRHLDSEHPTTGRPRRVLDVGAGQGTQALRLARLGHTVCAVEPDPRMRAAFESALAGLEAAARERVTLRAGDLTALEGLTDPAAYDLVLCHGVLMYLPESQPAIATLASRAAPGGILSVVARNGDALAWRPASRHDWAAAAALLAEQDHAIAEGRDPGYENEIGVLARADRVDDLLRTVEAEGLEVLAWYGVRLASDDVGVETPVPTPDELSVLLDVEERLGRTDPYRRLGTLVHVVAQRQNAADPVSAAFAAVPREGFLPEQSRRDAGRDGPISIGRGQTNSQPRTVESMLRLLDVRPGDRVLDVGAGSGWTTALLAALTGPTGSVRGVELEAQLAAWGSDNLAATHQRWARIDQATVGVLGDPDHGPYDRILVSAEARVLPDALVAQLADGGRMVIPVRGRMLLVRRNGADIATSEHGAYLFVPLR